MVELSGLRITLESIREEFGQIEITYSFAWTDRGSNFCIFRPWGTLVIQFWDADGKEMDENVPTGREVSSTARPAQLLTGVPDLHRVVRTGTDQAAAIGTEGHTGDGFGVAHEAEALIPLF